MKINNINSGSKEERIKTITLLIDALLNRNSSQDAEQVIGDLINMFCTIDEIGEIANKRGFLKDTDSYTFIESMINHERSA